MAKKIINIRLDDKLWHKVKVVAVDRGFSLQDWVEGALLMRLHSDGYDFKPGSDRQVPTEIANG